MRFKMRKRELIPFNTSCNSDPRGDYERLVKALRGEGRIIGDHPVNVQIQTVSACNGKCAFCPYHGSWHETHPGKMTWDTYEAIIDSIIKYKIRKFCPYFENEPLLDDELFDKIAYAVKRVDYEWVEVSTNLSILDEGRLTHIRKLFPGIPHEIWVSFHGVSEESYENIMGLDFERTMNNVMRLVSLAQEVPLNIKIRGSGTPVPGGTGSTSWFGREEYFRFWEKVLSRFSVKPEVSYFPYHDRAGAGQLKEKGIRFDGVAREDLTGFYCDRFDRWMHFLYTGEPVLCCMDYGKETGFDACVPDVSIDDLYRSPRFIELLKKGTGMIESADDFICKKCFSPGG